MTHDTPYVYRHLEGGAGIPAQWLVWSRERKYLAAGTHEACMAALRLMGHTMYMAPDPEASWTWKEVQL